MKVYKNLLWNLSLQFVTLGLPLITIPYISRVLGPTGVGINAYTSSFAQYFVLVAGLGIGLYGTRQIAESRDNKIELSNQFWRLIVIKITLGLILTGIYFLLALHSEKYQMFYAGQSLTLFATIVDVTWFFQGIELFRTTVLRNVFMRLISTICIFLLVKTPSDTLIYIIISSGSTLLANVILWFGIRRHVSFTFPFKLHDIFNDLKGAISLFIPQVATQIYYPISKMLIGLLIGVQASGFFENSDKIIKVIVGIITSFSTVFLPHITHFFANGETKKIKESFYNSFHIIVFAGLGLTGLMIVNAPQFCIWFFGNKFANVGELMQTEAAVIFFIAVSNTIGYQYLIPTGQVRQYNIGVIIGSMLNIILDIPLILLYGVLGAMVATVISEFVVVIILVRMLRSAFEYKMLFVENIKYLIAFAGSIIFAQFAVQVMKSSSIFLSLISVSLVSLVSYSILIIVLKPKILVKAIKYVLKL
ncbi:oligosaccharide flippase family protein [Pediococcus cellicola]|uniref:PST family polysaccharide transporter n=1 Tax=Pediococcus cellicola TaxID=319652 RepID=A0A0R2IM69_9LACO|nr:oligosaccharide flippase family protein [Pediococcus cellicola]KRN66063.1 PST family polysaccharide transporter [Pediococcus cellicola]GEL15466.1 flippase [Pediococcus cellicola]